MSINFIKTSSLYQVVVGCYLYWIILCSHKCYDQIGVITSFYPILRIEDDIIWDLSNFEKSSLTELLTNEDIEPKKIMIILFLFVNATQEE
jgi:hypothetical protein